MLVAKPRGSSRCGGSGIFDAISRKMLTSGFKKAISTGAKSAIAQKVADAACMNGPTSATQKAVDIKRCCKRSYKQVMLGKKRSSSGAGNVKLSKISWMMPRVQPNDEMKYKLYKSIESKSVLDAAFRMRQCNIVELPQSTTMTWGLGVRTATGTYWLQFKRINLVIKSVMHPYWIMAM